MKTFKAKPLKMIMVDDRRVLKFDDEGFYKTDDPKELKAIGGAKGVEEVKASKA